MQTDTLTKKSQTDRKPERERGGGRGARLGRKVRSN